MAAEFREGNSRADRTRHKSPPRINEAQIRKEQELGRSATDVPTTVLSLWQPLASFLAHGLQRVEGRGWSTQFRGKLWIHAGSKQVDSEDIAKWENIYRDIYSMDAHTNIHMPSQYPTSALVGLVEVVDVVPGKDFAKWHTLPRGVRHEGRCHGAGPDRDGHVFLVEHHQRLPLPLKMSGQHKLWRLDRKTACDAFKCLIPTEIEPPIRFIPHRDKACLTQGKSTEVHNLDDQSEPGDLEDAESDGNADELEASLLNLALGMSLAKDGHEESCESDSDLKEAIRLSLQDVQTTREQGSTSDGRRLGRWRNKSITEE